MAKILFGRNRGIVTNAPLLLLEGELMKVVICEPEGNGHRMALYVRHIVCEATKRGWQIKLATTERAIKTPAFQLVADECDAGLETFIMSHVNFPVSNPTTFNLLKYQFFQFLAFATVYRKFVKKFNPDFIYVASMDHCDKIISLLGSPFGKTLFGGILLSQKFHYRRIGLQSSVLRQEKLSEKLFYKLVKIPSMKLLNVIDKDFFDFVGNEKKTGYKKVQYVPDPAYIEGDILYTNARRILGISDSQFVILVYGALTERKGISQLLKAVGVLKKNYDVTVLLAGKQNSVVQKKMSRPDVKILKKDGRLIEVPGFLEDKDEYGVFRAADAVWLGYLNFYGMSGVLLQAGRMGLPVIACTNGLIGRVVRENNLGELVDPFQTQSIVEAIKFLIENNNAKVVYGINGIKHSMSHHPEFFRKNICDAIEGSVTENFYKI